MHARDAVCISGASFVVFFESAPFGLPFRDLYPSLTAFLWLAY